MRDVARKTSQQEKVPAKQSRVGQAHCLEIQHVVAISRVGNDGRPVNRVLDLGKNRTHGMNPPVYDISIFRVDRIGEESIKNLNIGLIAGFNSEGEVSRS
jgi:hypothetical protein